MIGTLKKMIQFPVSTVMTTIKLGTKGRQCQMKIGCATEHCTRQTRSCFIELEKLLELLCLDNLATRKIRFVHAMKQMT